MHMKVTRLEKLSVGLLIVFAGAILVNRAFGTVSDDSKTQDRLAAQRQKTSMPITKGINTTTPGPSSFKADMSFSEAIDILRNSTVPPLNIVVFWRDLERNADIYRDTPIGIDGVSGVPLRTHLKLLLISLSSNSPVKLGYTIYGGVIIISTQDSLPRRLRTRIYYIADLVAGMP